MSRSYLDALSGQPLHQQAQAAFEAFSGRGWADPTQPHHEGKMAAQILQASRESVANVLEIAPAGVSFQPSSCVARLAIEGVLGPSRSQSDRKVVTTAVERADVLEVLRTTVGIDSVSQLPVDQSGAILPLSLVEELQRLTQRGRTAVVMQAGNGEIGTLQPLGKTAATARGFDIPLVTDATGALGLVPIEPGWSVLFAEASTWAGPAGVAVLAVADPGAWSGPLPTDGADVLNSAAAAAALDAVVRAQPTLSAQLEGLTAKIRDRVPRLVDDVDLVGSATSRLPHVVTFSLLYADGEQLASELDRLGVAIGSGSACASRAGLPSHVLEAIGALTHGNVRVSLPLDATAESVDHFLDVLPEAARIVRAEAGAP
ncbi:MAG: aminotransferase class V-fold PLP-dependent enzyme [Candidatus Nanopelagicales bacterium]